MVRPAVLALVLLVAGCARMAAVPPSSLGPITLADGEHPERWAPNVVQTSDAADGDHAIAVDLAPGANFTYLLPDDAGVSIADAQVLTFCWKVDGPGLRSIRVSLRNNPPADGWYPTYDVWDSATDDPRTGWRSAAIQMFPFQGSDGDGGLDTKRPYIAFRAEVDAGTSPRPYLDSVVAVREMVDWDVGQPYERGGEWYAPATFQNLMPEPITVSWGPARYGTTTKSRLTAY